MQVLYQDNRIFVCIKPAGIVSTDEPGGMPEHIRAYLGDTHACVRAVHRLDQAVSGVMVYARSRMAASILSQQVRSRAMQKTYLAVVNGAPDANEGELFDLLWRDRTAKLTRVAAAPGKDVQPASLSYTLVAHSGGRSLLAIVLNTGRTHQIRVQLSSRDMPIVGDRKYGRGEDTPIALWSYALGFCHPQTGEPLLFSCPPPAASPWTAFDLSHLPPPAAPGHHTHASQ